MSADVLSDAPLPQSGVWDTPRRLHVLVVDDDALVRETLEQIIKALDAGDVTQVGSGRDAIDLVNGDPDRFDIVFCDLQMPGSDGLDVLAACANAGMKSALVLMSGSGENNLRLAVEQSRAWHGALVRTMAKPFSVAEIKAVLQGFTRGA